MQLPETLQTAIEKEIECYGLKPLIEAREDLSKRYQKHAKSLMQSDAHRLSYIISRLPATYAALCKAFLVIKERMPDLKIRSLMDMGAGPGTVMWAAKECFPEIEQMTLLEKDSALAAMGKKLASHEDAFKSVKWNLADLEHLQELPRHDLVIFSYSIGELSPELIPNLIQASWHSSEKLFVVVEPGTPVGFERIRSIRRQLIEMEGHLVAPCPHELTCPMSDGDWCHFAARVERSSLHRQLKSGLLGYEDEKFSYVAAAKSPYPLPQSRVLRHPLHRSGHVILTLCTATGLQRPTVSKRTLEEYKQARKLDWGDTFSWAMECGSDA